jgi:cholesterol transport system auxiliary component
MTSSSFFSLMGRRRALAALAAGLVLAGCSALPDKPQRPLMYDFGPGPTSTPPTTRIAALPTLALAEIEAAGSLDGTAVLYRLGYADAQQLRPYALARWSASPAQLVRQRVREVLGQRRTVLTTDEAGALARVGGALPYVLRLELDEFSHLFTSPSESVGLVRMRATVVESLPGGDRVLAQRSVIAQRPAPSPDANGGVKALAEATDAAIEDISQWLKQVR